MSSLLTVNADLSRVAAALERIANVLEYACSQPLQVDAPPVKKTTAEGVSVVLEEDTWLREQIESELEQTGAPEESIPGLADRIISKLKESNQLP